MPVLVEEYPLDDDYGHMTFPIHHDIGHVRDLIRIGADALSIRFREVDPLAWSTLIEVLNEA